MPRKHRPSRLPLLLLSLIAPFCVQPAQAQGSVTLQPDGSLLYSGDAARFSIGYSKGGKFQGELSGVLHEQANSAWLGEGWVAQSSGGLKLSYHQLQGATVHKYFLAHDQNPTRDRKITLGYGREESDWFGNLNLSRAITGRRLMGTTSSTTTLDETGVADGRPYIDTITRTQSTRFYEKAYDYGIGVRAGRTFDNRQVRITAGYDYEWGRSNAHQHTVSLMAEKAFVGTPHSVALQVDRVFKSGDLDTTRNETRAMVVYRYALGGNNSQPERLFRVTPVAAPVTAPSAEPTAAQIQAPQEPVKQWVKTKASMTAEAFFAFNSARLTPSAKAELDRVAQQLKTQGHEGNVLIIGHTCDLGSDAANDKLSLQRATAVRDYLVAAGAFGATESLAEGRGKRDPKYPAEPATREKNRRVELEFYSFVDEEQKVQPTPAPATTAVSAPQQPAVTYERELVDQPPAWVRQALRTPALHKRTVDVYRTKEETQTESRTRAWVNRAPTAADDAYQVTQSSSTTFPILANDTDPDQGDTLTLVSVGQPAQGRVRMEGSQVVYIAPANYVGKDSFTYSIRDQQGLTSTGQVAVTVAGTTTPTNRAPVAADDSYQVASGASAAMPVLSNDTDPDEGDTLTLASVTQPTKGSVRLEGQQLMYTAPSNYAGTEQFTYTVKDRQGLSTTARVVVTVTAITNNNHPPVAVADTYWVSGLSPSILTVLGNDSDPDGDALSIVSVTQPAGQTGSVQIIGTQILFTPKAPFPSDTFTYTISDGKGGQSTAMVKLIDP
ncbi:Ig-like domain-containing protein [Acidovorax sp. 106]|uniref:Ig-like domain-containing protein n=1 Tax=Acidovorax sp. 106 TaxID=2135637 RepID=UPI000EB30C8A|nr:Ig-like domain-containing protein [Acidovorax sp. 106]RLJ37410.1 outer membrane protein OmpA-like peptidoglycan-associated protein [Acidovorax sp. 106]